MSNNSKMNKQGQNNSAMTNSVNNQSQQSSSMQNGMSSAQIDSNIDAYKKSHQNPSQNSMQ